MCLRSRKHKIDITPNDKNDTLILNEVFCDRVDILISEDKKIHTKAQLLGIAEKVFRIEQFLEKVTAENPDLIDYKAVHWLLCRTCNVKPVLQLNKERKDESPK